MSQNAENSIADPLEETIGVNVFEAMNDKAEADGLVEDNEKGKAKAKQPKPESGRKKLKDNITPGMLAKVERVSRSVLKLVVLKFTMH